MGTLGRGRACHGSVTALCQPLLALTGHYCILGGTKMLAKGDVVVSGASRRTGGSTGSHVTSGAHTGRRSPAPGRSIFPHYSHITPHIALRLASVTDMTGDTAHTSRKAPRRAAAKCPSTDGQLWQPALWRGYARYGCSKVFWGRRHLIAT
jgi:hypothetical protein